MLKRRRPKQISLKERLAAWAANVRKQADQLAPGVERDALLKKASQADAAAHLDDWVSSPGLRPPK